MLGYAHEIMTKSRGKVLATFAATRGALLWLKRNDSELYEKLEAVKSFGDKIADVTKSSSLTVKNTQTDPTQDPTYQYQASTSNTKYTGAFGKKDRGLTGKRITFFTGALPKKVAGGDAYLIKSFSFRYPSWVNNVFALDFAYHKLYKHAKSNPARAEGQLYPYVKIGSLYYRMRAYDVSVSSVEPTTVTDPTGGGLTAAGDQTSDGTGGDGQTQPDAGPPKND